MERRLAAILATDVVGYSKLIREDEAHTLAALRDHREQIIEPKITERNGRIVKLTGDGLLAEFPSAVEAVQCAVEIQHLLKERSVDLPEEKKVVYRTGINIGDIVVEDEDIYGDGVNIAARLESLAEPGGVCITRNVFDQVKDKLDLTTEFLGDHEVKNIAEPIAIYRVGIDEKAAALVSPIIREATKPANPKAHFSGVALASIFAVGAVLIGAWQLELFGYDPSQATADERIFAQGDPLLKVPEGPSIFVLPFKNLTSSEEKDYFVDGLTEEIITELTRFRDLFVLARDTTFKQEMERDDDTQKIGRELNVQYVLSGTVRFVANRIRVTTQLINTSSGSRVWAETFEKEFTTADIFEIQDEISQSIVGAIGGGHGTIARAGTVDLKSPSTESLQAYGCLLQARKYHLRHNAEQHLIARNCLEKAVEIDPNFVEALAELAYVYIEEYRHEWNRLPDSIDRANKVALRAIELDSNNQVAHWALALTYFTEGRLELFEAETKVAVSINPNNSAITGYLGFFMAPTGRWEDGLELLDKSIKLNPKHPSWYHVAYFYDHFRKQEYEAALERLHLGGLKHLYFIQSNLAAIYGQLGQEENAKKAIERINEMKPSYNVAAARNEYAVKRNIEPDLVEHLIDGLRKAGLPE